LAALAAFSAALAAALAAFFSALRAAFRALRCSMRSLRARYGSIGPVGTTWIRVRAKAWVRVRVGLGSGLGLGWVRVRVRHHLGVSARHVHRLVAKRRSRPRGELRRCSRGLGASPLALQPSHVWVAAAACVARIRPSDSTGAHNMLGAPPLSTHTQT